jgi:hypothetical protein
LSETEYRQRTGAWVGLIFAVTVTALTISTPFYIVRSGFNLASFPRIFLPAFLVSLITVGCYAAIILRLAKPNKTATVAVVATSATGILMIILTPFNLPLLNRTILAPQHKSIVDGIFITSGLSLMLAIIGVLQMETVEERKVGCLWMIGIIAVGAVILYLFPH